MSITLHNGRVVEALLCQNNGDGRPGNELDLSPYLKEDGLGEISWEVDKELTKLSLGTISVTLEDDPVGQPVWSFIEAGLTSDKGLLPPWFILTIDGVQTFIGLVKDSPERSESAEETSITFTATSWISMLDKKKVKVMDSNFIRTFPKDTTATSQGPTITARSVYNKELRRGHDRTLVAVDAAQDPNFKVGDWVYFNNYDIWTQYNKPFQIVGKQIINVGGIGVCLALYLGSGFWWSETPQGPQNYGQESTLYRIYTSTSELPAYLVDEDFDPQANSTVAKTSFKLTNVDRLLPGDKLEKVSNFTNPDDSPFTVTIVDVDPIDKVIYVDNPINSKLVKGVTSLILSKESAGDSVFMPVNLLLEKALMGLGTIDYSAYSPATMNDLSFGFISPSSSSMQNARTETISGPLDIQPSLTEVEIKGSGNLAWTGLPSLGWNTVSWTKTVNWTEQLNTAPAYLMPYYHTPVDRNPDEIETRGRTRYADMKGYGDDNKIPRGSNTTYKYIYDYSSFRVYQFRYVGTSCTISAYTYNGSAWTTVSGVTNTVSTTFKEAVPFKDITSSNGSGYGLLALYSDNTVKTVASSVNLSKALPDDAKTGCILKQTPNGVYFITDKGYGKFFINAGLLDYKYTTIFNPNQIQKVSLIPSTFVYVDGHIVSLAKASYKAKITDERWSEDTYLFQLTAEPQALPKDSVISFDFIVKNIPRTTMAVRSPDGQQVIGLMGSRLFLISKTIPDTIERFQTGTKTASSLIEWATTITNTVAFPLVKGGLKLITRGHYSTPVALTVEQVTTTESRWSETLCNCVVVKGFNTENPGVAISDTQYSGITISYTNEVFIRNTSQARAIANSYLAFYEKPRVQVEQDWYSSDAVGVWESLQPFQVVTINTDPTEWYVMGVTYSVVNQTAKIKLLQV